MVWYFLIDSLYIIVNLLSVSMHKDPCLNPDPIPASNLGNQNIKEDEFLYPDFDTSHISIMLLHIQCPA